MARFSTDTFRCRDVAAVFQGDSEGNVNLMATTTRTTEGVAPGTSAADLAKRTPAGHGVRPRQPEQSRKNILKAALKEFAARGFGGARVDRIASRAKINKRMIYHYYGGKEKLYIATLEHVYEMLRKRQREFILSGGDPQEEMRLLVDQTFLMFLSHPEFIGILNNENLHKAKYIKRSPKIRELHPLLIEKIALLLERGQKMGLFRHGVDPTQLYLSIAAETYFYLSNAYTLGATFGRDLLSEAALKERRAVVVDVILRYLRP